MIFSERFAAGALISALLLILAHYLPWPTERPPRLAAYAVGTFCLLIGVAIWLADSHPEITAGIALLDVIGGAAVTACYVLDWWLNQRARAKAGRYERND